MLVGFKGVGGRGAREVYLSGETDCSDWACCVQMQALIVLRPPPPSSLRPPPSPQNPGEEQPKFLAVLDARDNGLSEPEPIFSVVETNQFKYLTHLSLRLRGANDSELKRYLASRLSQAQRAMAE